MELSLALWLGALFPLLFAWPSFQSQLDRFFFQEAFTDPPFLAGPVALLMCLIVPCVMCSGSGGSVSYKWTNNAFAEAVVIELGFEGWVGV